MNYFSRPSRTCLLALAMLGLGASPSLFGEDPDQPTFRTFGGAFLISDQHDFFVESELHLPIWTGERFGLYYRYRETTPFLGLDVGGEQAELLYTRNEFQADLKLNEAIRLIAVAGYHARFNQDHPGKKSTYMVGAGLGSPRGTGKEILEWEILAGAYIDQDRVRSDWWSDARVSWRVLDLGPHQHLETEYTTALVLSADAETANQQDQIQGLYRVGPELQFLTAAGHRANLHARWYYSDRNEFYRSRENGLLVGFELTASLDPATTYDARAKRASGLFPQIWGAYDLAIGDQRRLTRFELNVEAFDLNLANHLYTFFVWYESRQEHRIGDYDNINYSVSMGGQSTVGWASWLSQGNPLVMGCDMVHRSDHALNPDRSRMRRDGLPSSDPTIGRLIRNSSLNLFPRLRLQTIGWDLPYRDPTMYEDKIELLNNWDWRVTIAYDMGGERERYDFAGQLGLKCDVATIRGFVIYGEAIGSIGNETPDWHFEIGVRRPLYRVFTRYEDFGVKTSIAEGKTLVAGIGFNL